MPYPDEDDSVMKKGENHISALMKEAFQAFQNRAFHHAAGLCKQILAQDPHFVEAHFLIGLISAEMGDTVTAQKAFKTALGLRPHYTPAWAHLAHSFAITNQFSNAKIALEKVKGLAIDDPVSADVIAASYRLMGQIEKALDWQKKAGALALKAGNLQAGQIRLAEAHSLISLGRLAEARVSLEQILQQTPYHGEAHWLLARLDTARDEAHVRAMEKILEGNSLPKGMDVFLYYAIAKEYEDLEAWDKAFAAYAKGAAAKKNLLPFDEKSEIALFAALETLFSEAWCQATIAFEPRDAASPIPAFIMGQPRTGTTLLERVLCAHSQVASLGELQLITGGVRALTKTPGTASGQALLRAENIIGFAESDIKRLGHYYEQGLAALWDSSGQKSGGRKPYYLIDKMPVNYQLAPLIAKSLPQAGLILMRRGAMDSCFASFKQLFAGAYAHSYDLEEMARHYIRYHHLIERWQERLGERLYIVDYEKLAEDIRLGSAPAFAALKLDFEPACLDFYKQNSAVLSASAVQVRQKAHTRSVEKWQRFEKHLQPMLKLLEGAAIIAG